MGLSTTIKSISGKWNTVRDANGDSRNLYPKLDNNKDEDLGKNDRI